jgi:hypothetical protein
MGSSEADNIKVPHFVREDNQPGEGELSCKGLCGGR